MRHSDTLERPPGRSVGVINTPERNTTMQTFTPQRASVQPKIRAARRKAAALHYIKLAGKTAGAFVLALAVYLTLVVFTV